MLFSDSDRLHYQPPTSQRDHDHNATSSLTSRLSPDSERTITTTTTSPSSSSAPSLVSTSLPSSGSASLTSSSSRRKNSADSMCSLQDIVDVSGQGGSDQPHRRVSHLNQVSSNKDKAGGGGADKKDKSDDKDKGKSAKGKDKDQGGGGGGGNRRDECDDCDQNTKYRRKRMERLIGVAF